MSGEMTARPRFPEIKYAQCWEDADVMLQALSIRPNSTCLSIASAGDNTLALLAHDPETVIALDTNPSQLACLELRVAALRELARGEVLELIGSRPSTRRSDLFKRCSSQLSSDARWFWDHHAQEIDRGIGAIGKFENYFRLFRKWVLPMAHSRREVQELLKGGNRNRRLEFFEQCWNGWLWRSVFRLFFSRFVMERLGRDPACFHHVNGKVADRIKERADFAITELDPADNPYLQWIFLGRHLTALPFWLRKENFERIRENVNRLEWNRCSLKEYLPTVGKNTFDAFNLSNIFEYMSEDQYHQSLQSLANVSRPRARLVYWNLLVQRSRPAILQDVWRPLEPLQEILLGKDKAFFYNKCVVEELCS